MSESDLYRKQRVAIENVARTISVMEQETGPGLDDPDSLPLPAAVALEPAHPE
jgi:hypothetical protein